MSKEVEERDVSREEASEQLQEIAGALRTGEAMDIEVDNRTVHLSPGEQIAVELTVEEKSAILGGNREAVTVKLDWEPQ